MNKSFATFLRPRERTRFYVMFMENVFFWAQHFLLKKKSSFSHVPFGFSPRAKKAFSHVVHDHNKNCCFSVSFQLIVIFFGGLCEVLEHEHKQEEKFSALATTWFKVTWINFHKSAIETKVEKASELSVSEAAEGVIWRLWACLSASYQEAKSRSSYRHFGFGLSVISLHLFLSVWALVRSVTPKHDDETNTQFLYIVLFISRFHSVSRDFDSFSFYFILVFVHFKQLVIIHSAARAFPLSVWLKHR